MKIDYLQASYEMKHVTGIIDNDVFDLGGIGLLIISANGTANAANACAQIKYELLDEVEREEWFAENTPDCGNRDHVGWCCTKETCAPF